MGVHINPARGDDGTVGVERFSRRTRDGTAHLNDAAIAHGHIATYRRATGPVDERPALDHVIEHRSLPCRGPTVQKMVIRSQVCRLRARSTGGGAMDFHHCPVVVARSAT